MTGQTHTDELTQFDQAWLAELQDGPMPRIIFGLVGLTRFGEHPAPLDRLATIVARAPEQTATLVERNTNAHIRDGWIHWDTPFPLEHTRRRLLVGNRTIPMSRCAPAVFVYAVILDVPFAVEEICPATATPIRIDFVPGGYERVDPPDTVVAMFAPHNLHGTGHMSLIDSEDVCAQMPLFASRHAAAGWLADHPGGRVFTITEMFQRPLVIHYRDHLRPLINPLSQTVCRPT